MKKTILIIALLAISTSVISQISLINNYNSYGYSLFPTQYNTNNIVFCPNRNTLNIYDEDLILVKTINNLPTFSMVSSLSKNLFTLSGKYEVVLSIMNSSTNKTEFKLYNEDGQLLFDFGEWHPSKIINNKLFASLSVQAGDGTYYYNIKIYSLPGQLSSSIETNVDNYKSIAFPNPTESLININYSINKIEEMQIIDLNGNIIENLLLDPSLKIVNINVSNYPKGIYIYKLGNYNGKFIVK